MTANSRRHWLGGTCLATGVIALALAIIPPTVHGRPLNLPWRVEEKPAEAPQVAEARTEPRVKFRLGKLSVGFGEKQVAVPQAAPTIESVVRLTAQ